MKQILTLHALEDVDVSCIGFVKAGANRAPWKIMKSDGPKPKENAPMIDFQKLFKIAPPAVPTVAAIIVSKDADQDFIKARIEAAGFLTDSVEEQGDVFLYKQITAALDTEDVVVIKFDDDLAVMVQKISKTFSDMNFGSGDFDEVLSQEGFFPSMRLGMDILGHTIGNIMSKAEAQSEAATEIDDAIVQFRGYVSDLLSAIPTEAFKLEDPMVIETAKKAHPDKKKKKDEETGADEGKQVADPGEGEGTGVQDPDPEKPGIDAAGQEMGALVKATIEAALVPLRESISSVATSTSKMAEQISALDTRVGELDGVAKAAGEQAASTAKLVKGSVQGDADDPDKGKHLRLMKDGDKGGAPPMLDTAYARR